MNKAILVGNLTKDPEIKQTERTKIANFTLAIQRPYPNQNGEREADFIPIVVLRQQTSEFVEKYLKKGSKVGVDGRIQVRSYDAKDGTRRYITEVFADNVYLLDSKGSDAPTRQNPEEEEENTQFTGPKGLGTPTKQGPKEGKSEDETKYDDVKFTNDDLPF